jgi:Fe2+ transport system protein FeoA
MRTAAKIKFGEKVIINDIDTSNPSHQRIIEIGFTPGQEIQLVNISAFDDPMAFSVRGTLIAMRRKEADCIIVA